MVRPAPRRFTSSFLFPPSTARRWSDQNRRPTPPGTPRAAAPFQVLDAVYFAVGSLATVGYGDMTPTTDSEKLFTCGCVLLSVTLIASALGEMISRVIHMDDNPDPAAFRPLRAGLCDGQSA